jgi:hypothetical protein
VNGELLRSMARSLAGIWHPRVLWLTLQPFLVAGIGWALVFWLGWDTLTGWAQALLQPGFPGAGLLGMLGSFASAGMRLVMVPLLVLLVSIPLIVVTALLSIAMLSMPAIVRHLVRRHYTGLEARRGGSAWGSLGHSLWVTLVFVVLMAVSLPLWLIPPMFAIIPPVLWGWASYRVMSYDALAEHASAAERRAIGRRHRLPLLIIGVTTGLMGSLPTLMWASSVLWLVTFPLVAALAVWLYVLIFMFSALWFAHYCLHALQSMRALEADSSSGQMLITKHNSR